MTAPTRTQLHRAIVAMQRPPKPLPLALAPIATDQRTIAERAWKAGTVAAKPQKAMDIGLWSDSAAQLDLLTRKVAP